MVTAFWVSQRKIFPQYLENFRIFTCIYSVFLYFLGIFEELAVPIYENNVPENECYSDEDENMDNNASLAGYDQSCYWKEVKKLKLHRTKV